MKEGSYLEIEEGMPVLGRGEEDLGLVEEVLEDEGSGIFVGLVVKTGGLFGRSMLVRGEAVERVHGGMVYVNARGRDLEPYVSPEAAIKQRASAT